MLKIACLYKNLDFKPKGYYETVKNVTKKCP